MNLANEERICVGILGLFSLPGGRHLKASFLLRHHRRIFDKNWTFLCVIANYRELNETEEKQNGTDSAHSFPGAHSGQ